MAEGLVMLDTVMLWSRQIPVAWPVEMEFVGKR
jgi:hypothetical protein